jgi:hypothetical protein
MKLLMFFSYYSCYGLVVLVLVIRATATAAAAAAATAAKFSAASSMPRLPPGNHLGALTGFDVYDAQAQIEVDSRLAQLQAAGMITSRIQLDWVDLEPQPFQYDATPLLEALQTTPEGSYCFVLIATVDSGGVAATRPLDLQDTLYAEPLLWQRFAAVLEQVILPTLASMSNNRAVFLLSVGNEPGSTHLEEHPSELQPLADFVHQTRTLVHATQPDLAVGLTMDTIYKEIADASDIVIFNHYGLDPTELTVIDDPQDFLTALTARRAIFGFDRPFVIQELGIPSGWEHDQESSLGGTATPAFAAQVTAVMLEELRTNEQWRAAFWFTTVDWSVSTTQLILDEFAGEADTTPGMDLVIARVNEWLRTGGLLRYQQPDQMDMSARPVWDVFIQGMTKLYNVSSSETAVPVGTFTSPPPTMPPSSDKSVCGSRDNTIVKLVLLLLAALLAIPALV